MPNALPASASSQEGRDLRAASASQGWTVILNIHCMLFLLSCVLEFTVPLTVLKMAA